MNVLSNLTSSFIGWNCLYDKNSPSNFNTFRATGNVLLPWMYFAAYTFEKDPFPILSSIVSIKGSILISSEIYISDVEYNLSVNLLFDSGFSSSDPSNTSTILLFSSLYFVLKKPKSIYMIAPVTKAHPNPIPNI